MAHYIFNWGHREVGTPSQMSPASLAKVGARADSTFRLHVPAALVYCGTTFERPMRTTR